MTQPILIISNNILLRSRKRAPPTERPPYGCQPSIIFHAQHPKKNRIFNFYSFDKLPRKILSFYSLFFRNIFFIFTLYPLFFKKINIIFDFYPFGHYFYLSPYFCRRQNILDHLRPIISSSLVILKFVFQDIWSSLPTMMKKMNFLSLIMTSKFFERVSTNNIDVIEAPNNDLSIGGIGTVKNRGIIQEGQVIKESQIDEKDNEIDDNENLKRLRK